MHKEGTAWEIWCILIALIAVCTIFLITGFVKWTGTAVEFPRVLRMGLIAPVNHPVTRAAERFKQLVEEDSQGKIRVELFPGGTLGGEVEMQDMVSVGILQMASIGNGIPPNYNPQFLLLQMPFIWDNPGQMLAFAQSPLQDELNERYLQTSGIRILASNWDQGVRHTLSKIPLQTLEDFQLLKIRVPQVPAWLDVWELLGATPVAIAFPEVYIALQQGVVNAMESPLYWIYSSSLHEQAKHLILTGHVMYYNHVIINDEVFQQYPHHLQTVLQSAAVRAGEYETALIRKVQSEIEANLKAAGVTFLSIDRQSLIEEVQPVYEEWSDVYGEPLLKRVQQFKREY